MSFGSNGAHRAQIVAKRILVAAVAAVIIGGVATLKMFA